MLQPLFSYQTCTVWWLRCGVNVNKIGQKLSKLWSKHLKCWQNFGMTDMLKIVYPPKTTFFGGIKKISSTSDFIHTFPWHTCEPFLMDMREIWFSFQGDWSLHQGDYSTAFLTRHFKLFSVKLERNFKQYINYSSLCFKFTLKLTKISTKYIKTERFQCN